MKSVILFRHGNASFDRMFLNDHERTLEKQGVKDAEKMGECLFQKNEIPDLVISSTATRAQSTAEAAMKKGKWKCPIIFNKIIYSGSTNDLLILIKEQNDKYDSICMVGHEPKFSNFVDLSTNKEHTYFSTATIAKIDFNIPKWSLIEFGFGNLDWLISPKELN